MNRSPSPSRLPTRQSDWRSLMRLLATYMAIVLVMQALAGSQARALGPLHHHRGDHPPAPTVRAASAQAAPHAHADGQRHWHAAENHVRAVRDAGAGEDLDLAAWALAAAMALLACAVGLRSGTVCQPNVWCAGTPWSVSQAPPRRPYEPPRQLLSH